jgi:AmmeMemoRadiSam system protein B
MLQDELHCNRSLPFSREELLARINEQPYGGQDGIRMIFLPPRLTEQNVDEFCYIYRQLMDTSYNVAVIVEPDHYESFRKLPLLPGNSVNTPFGALRMEERLRDDFCDEEDDLFIRDKSDFGHLGFFDHVSMLQLVQKDIEVIGIQMLDESPPLVQELTYVLKEILPFKNAIAIFCCELAGRYQEMFGLLQQLITEQNDTRLLNLIYSGDSQITGAGIFLAGLQVAREREREIRFFRDRAATPDQNLLAAQAGFPDR